MRPAVSASLVSTTRTYLKGPSKHVLYARCVSKPFREVFGAADLVVTADAIDRVEEIVVRDVETWVRHFIDEAFSSSGQSS